MDESNPNYEKGEFRLIQQLIKSLPNGLKIKQEVRLSKPLIICSLPRRSRIPAPQVWNA